ncbi:MAG: hypothetical protein ACI85Q_002750, partial [Salibacteraceae bacterium]
CEGGARGEEVVCFKVRKDILSVFVKAKST